MKTVEVPADFIPYMSGLFTCNFCGEAIRTIRTQKEKATPVDGFPVLVEKKDLKEDGSGLVLVDRMGSNRQHFEGEIGFESHFGTCTKWDRSSRIVAGAHPPKMPLGSPTALYNRVRYMDESIKRLMKGIERLGKPQRKTALQALQRYNERTLKIIEGEEG